MTSSQVDNELCVRHSGGKLTAAMTKHVGDLKTTGEVERVKTILSELQRVFGELKVEWYTFTNCGVKHVQDQVTKDITLDQIAYVGNLHNFSPTAHGRKTGGLLHARLAPALHVASWCSGLPLSHSHGHRGIRVRTSTTHIKATGTAREKA